MNPRRKAKSTTRALLALTALVLAVVGVGCPCLAPIVNADPQFRWWLFSNFGAQRICPEMLKQGIPLRLQERAPAIGRFFPQQCNAQVDNTRQTVVVDFYGTGYGYVAPAKRVGFSCGGAIEFRPDFQIVGNDIYVWGKLNRIVNGPNFQVQYVENKLVDVATGVSPVGSLANFLGNQVVAGELARGFTVVANDKGNEFAMGTLLPPQKPYRPWDITGTNRFTYANETVELHANQRDYLGPFEVKDGKALYVNMTVQGLAVDVMIVDKTTGDFWRDGYQKGFLLPPTGPVAAGQPVYPSYPVNLRYKLPNGVYYVVVDNTITPGGAVGPPTMLNPLADAVASVAYLVQLGD